VQPQQRRAVVAEAAAAATAHAAPCTYGGRHLATRNELQPFLGPDSYALYMWQGRTANLAATHRSL